MALGRESGNQQRSSRKRRIPPVQESDVKEGTSLRFNTKHLRCSVLTPPQSNTNKGQHYAGSNRHSNPKPPVPGSFESDLNKTDTGRDRENDLARFLFAAACDCRSIQFHFPRRISQQA